MSEAAERYRREGDEFVAALRDMEAAAKAVVTPSEAGLLDRVADLRKAMQRLDAARTAIKDGAAAMKMALACAPSRKLS
jgi:hypothetical protein